MKKLTQAISRDAGKKAGECEDCEDGVIRGVASQGMQTVIKKTEQKPCPVNGSVNWTTFDYANMQIRFADILTTDSLMAQALESYLGTLA